MGQVVQVDHIIVSWIYEPSLDCTTDDGRRTTDDDDDDDDEEYGYSEDLDFGRLRYFIIHDDDENVRDDDDYFYDEEDEDDLAWYEDSDGY
jgi:hypothetical protein